MDKSNMKVCVIGLGYIGLPTAATLASNGYKVLGIDVNQNAVDTINAGRIHIVESGLEKLVKVAVERGDLLAKTAMSETDQCDIFMIAVPTPFMENKKPDLRFVQAAIESLAPHLKRGDCVVLESTSPVGTTAKIASWIKDLRPDLSVPEENVEAEHDINIAYCPERVLPGKILFEIVHNDRIIGGLTKNCADKVQAFYKTFVKGECITTKARTAAMCKLTENAYRDVNIAFANELSMICDEQGIDVWELRELANRHPRVNVLKPGPGVGGHCIAVDPWFIVDASPERSRLIKTAREVNDYKPLYLVQQIQKKLQHIESPRILCLGLSYKPNVDDLRESPAVEVVKLLAKNKHFQVYVCEPHVDVLPEELLAFNNVSLCDYQEISLDDFDHFERLAEHDVFISIEASDARRAIIKEKISV